jgi:hypothetical protein
MRFTCDRTKFVGRDLHRHGVVWKPLVCIVDPFTCSRRPDHITVTGHGLPNRRGDRLNPTGRDFSAILFGIKPEAGSRGAERGYLRNEKSPKVLICMKFGVDS